MKLKQNIDIIFEKLAILSTEIKLRGRFNMFDINVVSETFFAELMNIVFGCELKNVNIVEQNAKSIDLIDENGKLIVQVSSDNSKGKVQKSLSGIDTSKYAGYKFKFISISKDAGHLSNYKFMVPNGITFDPSKDCYDKETLIRHIQDKGSETIASVCEYLNRTIVTTEKKDIRPEAITYVINQLADIDLSEYDDSQMPTAFDFQPKIDKNKLRKWNDLIQTYYLYSMEVDKIYRTFDKESRNQSTAVLFRLKGLYLNLKKQYEADDLFDKLKEEVYGIVDGDATCSQLLTKDQLELNISLVLIDAFMKCKIFEKP